MNIRQLTTKMGTTYTPWGCVVVEWGRSRPLDCEVRGSNNGQGRNFKWDFCFIRTPVVVKACHPCRVRP